MDLSGHYVGVLALARLIGALKQHGSGTRIVDVMLKADDIPVSVPEAHLVEIWDKMMEWSVRIVAIQEQAEFLGPITINDTMEVHHVLSAAKGNDLSGAQDNIGTKVCRRAVDA